MPKDYETLLHAETERLFREHYGGRRKVLEPTFLAIATAVITLLLIYWVKEGVIVDDIWLAIIPTIFVPAIYATYIWYRLKNKAHENLYRNMEFEAIKHTWKDVEVKKYDFPKHSGFTLGVQLINYKPAGYEIQFMKIFLEELVQGGRPMISEVVILPLLGGVESALWERESERIISQNDEDKDRNNQIFVIPLVKHDEDQVWIEGKSQSGELKTLVIEKNIVCSLKISIQEGKACKFTPPMDFSVLGNLEFSCELIYLNEDGKKSFSLAIIDRSPPFEYRGKK